jgi:hypothetical protein
MTPLAYVQTLKYPKTLAPGWQAPVLCTAKHHGRLAAEAP